MKGPLFILCFTVTVMFAQPGTPALPPTDSINFLDNWRHFYTSGEYSSAEFEALLDSLGEFDPNDTLAAHKYRNLMRSKWYFQSRTGILPNGYFDYESYDKAFKSYLGSTFCNNVNFPEKPWELVGPIGNQMTTQNMGQISAVLIDITDPTFKTFIVGSPTAGIFRTTDMGATWTCVTDNLEFPTLGVSNFSVDPNNPYVIFASTGISHIHLNEIGIGLLKSTDAGQSWSPVSVFTTGNIYQSFLDVEFDETNSSVLYTISDRVIDKRLFKSTDGGNTWTDTPLTLNSIPSQQIPDGQIVDIESLENGRIFISVRNYPLKNTTVYYSDNQGNTWIALPDLPVIVDEFSFSTSPSAILGWTSFTSGGAHPYDNGNNPIGSYSPGWSMQAIDGVGALNLEPESPNQIYYTIKGFPVFNITNGSSYLANIKAQIPANTTFRIYLYYLASAPSTFGQELFYEYSNNNASSFQVDISNLPYIPPHAVYEGLRFEIETHSGYDNSSAEDFWIKHLSFGSLAPSVNVFSKLKSSDNSMLMISEVSGPARNVYRTTDGGNNFEYRFGGSGVYVTGGTPSRMYAVELTNNHNSYFSGGVSLFQFTAFGGNSYACSFCHADVRGMDIQYDPLTGQDIILVGNDGGVSLSTDSGNNWLNINSNLSNSQIFSIDIHESSEKILGGYMDNGTMSYQPGIGFAEAADGDGTCSYISPEQNDKTISNDPQHNEFDFGNGWLPSDLSNMSLHNNGDTYLGMPLESSYSNYAEVFFGLDKTDDAPMPHAKLIKYNTSTPTIDPIKFDFPAGVSGGATNEVNSICISESQPTTWFVSLKAQLNYSLFRFDNDGTIMTALINSGTSVLSGTTSNPMSDVLNHGREIRDIAVSHTTSDKVWLAIDNTVIDYNGTDEAIHEKWRVIYSDNGGAGPVWYDYSEGLPGLPVNTILYVDGYNDLLFVGTDAGIYYRNADMDQWECFNNGFPLVVVTDLEFDYCHKTLYASTFGRSIYKCEIPFDLGGSDGNSAELVIDQNTLWDADMSIRQTVRILPGKTLTVTATIDMLTDRKIIVEQGAKLLVQGGTLTNLCDGFWGGVEVWGTTAESQFGNAQGEIVMSNGAKIEHAEVAVALWKPGNWDKTGGIILAYNSNFRNNKKDVEFISYSNTYNGAHYANKGQFTDCNFYWDDEFRTDIPLAHVTLYRVDGVKFLGCTFADNRTAGSVPLSSNIIGIKSIDASYRVAGRCTGTGICSGEIDDPGSGWDPSIFVNLYFGIYATNATSTYAINVDRCIFTDNGYGILISAMPLPVIIRSKFEFTDLNTHAFTPFTMHGIHAVNSKMLKIEENKFIDSDPGGNSTFGIVSSELGEQQERIYKNSFEGLTYANFAQGNNGNSSLSAASGLYFPCNGNTTNNFDHKVVSTLWGLPATSPGVRPVSGSFTIPTGSSFSTDPGDLIHNEDYSNSSTQLIRYWYHISQTPDDYSLFTVQMMNNLSAINNSCTTTLTNYPSGIGKLTPTDKSTYTSGFYSTNNQISEKEEMYQDNLLNATETATILLAVANLKPNNKQTVRNMLNSYSPYLTTEILFAVADNTPSDFNHPWLRDLFLANIEAVTPELLRFLETKEYPLPAPMRQTISNAVGTTYTQRTVLESEISQLYADRAFYSYQIMAGIVQDTTDFETDSLRYWVTLQNNMLSQQLIIDSYLHDGDLNAAKLAIDTYAAYANSAPAHLRQEVLDFVKLKRKLLLILQTPGYIASLDEENLKFLREMALNGSGTARYQAQDILCFFYNECDYYYFETEPDTRAPEKGFEITSDEKQPEFRIYPNPAGNWVMIELTLESFDQLENAEILITDLTGKVVHQTNLTRNTYLWETGSIQNGVYLILIKSNNTLFEVQKVIINR